MFYLGHEYVTCVAGVITFDSFHLQHSFCFLQPCLTCVNQPKTLAVSEVISFLSLQVFVRKARLKDWRDIQGITLRGILTAGGRGGGGRFMRVPSAVSEL